MCSINYSFLLHIYIKYQLLSFLVLNRIICQDGFFVLADPSSSIVKGVGGYVWANNNVPTHCFLWIGNKHLLWHCSTRLDHSQPSMGHILCLQKTQVRAGQAVSSLQRKKNRIWKAVHRKLNFIRGTFLGDLEWL